MSVLSHPAGVDATAGYRSVCARVQHGRHRLFSDRVIRQIDCSYYQYDLPGYVLQSSSQSVEDALNVVTS